MDRGNLRFPGVALECRLFTWLVHIHVLRAYCIFESNQASLITLSRPRLNNKAPLGIVIIDTKPLLFV